MKPYYLAIPAAVELFLLIRRGWRTTLQRSDPVVFVTGFGHIAGRTVGFVANQPMVLAGVLDY